MGRFKIIEPKEQFGAQAERGTAFHRSEIECRLYVPKVGTSGRLPRRQLQFALKVEPLIGSESPQASDLVDRMRRKPGEQLIAGFEVGQKPIVLPAKGFMATVTLLLIMLVGGSWSMVSDSSQ